MATDVATDQAGNSYVSGAYAGTVDFDLGGSLPGDLDILTARGSADAFVAKYAPADSLLWVRSLGGDAESTDLTDIVRKVAVGSGGVVYVAGEFAGSADFGSTTLLSAGDDDGFVAKLDPDGNVQWAQQWGNAVEDSARAIDVDAAGNVYVLGSRLGDAYDIMKFDAVGGAVWSKIIVNRSMLGSADLAVNAAGTVYVAGSFDGRVDFDPSGKSKYVSSGPKRAAFVLKLDTDGKFGWVSPFVGKTVGSTYSASGATSIALDGGGNVIVGGVFNGTVDFNPSRGTTYLSTKSGGFITKLNSSGGLVWARALHGSSGTSVYGLDVDAAGNIYATGSYHGTVDFDPGAGVFSRTASAQGDIYAMKLTASGSFAWAETFGGAGNDVTFGVAVDPAGDVHIAGYYRDPFDVNPDPSAVDLLIGTGEFSRGLRLRLKQP